ncbi:MAG: DUF58 domain-containing protein [Bacteroidales bacterium]
MDRSIDTGTIEQFRNLSLIARQVVEGFIVGLHQSPFHGFSVEFAEHRLYNSGESIRHIDWKLYGRTDRLYVKRYEEETNLRCRILLDVSSSMYFPEKTKVAGTDKITFAIHVAAALIYLFRKQRDAFGLTLFSDSPELHTDARSSMAHQKYLYTELEKYLPPQPKGRKKTTSTVETIHTIADQIHKRSLVIILSDMLDQTPADRLADALQHLRFNKHEVILFHITDKTTETDFSFENRPTRFVDLETGGEVRLNPAEIRNNYRQKITQKWNELTEKCGQYDIDLVEADIREGFRQVLLPYLVKREKLY